MRSLFIITFFVTSNLYASDADITRYGAVGDGKTLNTEAIQNAIDACSKSGGGKVNHYR